MADTIEWSDWIEWRGGDCPVGGDVLVSVRLKDCREDEDIAEVYEWDHVCDSGNIIAYRIPVEHKKSLTGGRVNYYLATVSKPQREGQPPYTAECEDIIQALGMTFDEGCIFKALWRSAAARKGYGKPEHKAVYDAEKMVHYANRVLKFNIQQKEND